MRDRHKTSQDKRFIPPVSCIEAIKLWMFLELHRTSKSGSRNILMSSTAPEVTIQSGTSRLTFT